MLLMLTFKQILTSAKEVMFLCGFVCLFVHLFVCVFVKQDMKR